MHIDRTHQIAVSSKATALTSPNSAFGFVLLSTSGTLARCSSFGASEAQDAGLFCFVTEVVDIFAVLPQRHALIVVPATRTLADAVRIADEERSDSLLHTKVDDCPRCLMTHLPHTSFRPLADRVFRALQLLPTLRILLATGLLFGQLPQLFDALPLEAANASAGDNHRLAGIGGDCRKMDLTQIDGGASLPRNMCCLRRLETDM
jgi:hypothetical protein